MIKGLAHIGLFIKDIEAAKSFYRDILGFELTCERVGDDGAKICFARRGDCHLELVQLAGDPPECDGFVDHVALLVDDIIATRDELLKKGVVFETKEPVFLSDCYAGSYYMMFRGACGEHLEIAQML